MISCMQRCEYHDKYDTMNSNNNFMGSNSMRRDTTCTSNGDCDGDNWFCDFENENTGYCQDCTDYIRCEKGNFNKHGMISCEQTCEYHDKRDNMNEMGFYSRDNMRNNMMENNRMFENRMENDRMFDNRMENDRMQNNRMRDNMFYNRMGNDRMQSNMFDRSSTCSSNNECGDERFCNFESENNGYCESCSHINDCQSEDFNTKHGMISCMQRCEYHDKYDTMNSNNNFMGSNSMRRDSSCTSNGDCDGDNWFCDFENENTGYCQSCSSFRSCENAMFTNKHGMVSCMETCEYHDKRDMNEVGFNDQRGNMMRNYLSHSILEKSSGVVIIFAVVGFLVLVYSASNMIYKKIYPSDRFKKIIDDQEF